MPRERLRPGEHGRITERSSGGKYFAVTYVRDHDGKRRRVERSSEKSAEDARRTLQRHLAKRRPPKSGQLVNEKTVLGDLFDLWVEAKAAEDGVKQQTVDQYRAVWRTHGAAQLGSLRVTELETQNAHNYIQGMASKSQAKRLRMVLMGMFSMACRFDVMPVNPMRETKTVGTGRRKPRSADATELRQIRAAVHEYANRKGSGPRPGRLLPAFVELLIATGCRPNEVLATRWCDVDLLADPPTLTITGTLIDHGRIAGKSLHRQDERKAGAPDHTVILPKFGVETLTALIGESGMDGPVFVNRDGGWMSLANLRRSMRAALPEELSWVTPHSFRRTVATVIRDELGPDKAQQQLSHAKLATTEAHYLQRQTQGPDARSALEQYWESSA